jgi:hypothetical protein
MYYAHAQTRTHTHTNTETRKDNIIIFVCVCVCVCACVCVCVGACVCVQWVPWHSIPDSTREYSRRAAPPSGNSKVSARVHSICTSTTESTCEILNPKPLHQQKILNYFFSKDSSDLVCNSLTIMPRQRHKKALQRVLFSVTCLALFLLH